MMEVLEILATNLPYKNQLFKNNPSIFHRPMRSLNIALKEGSKNSLTIEEHLQHPEAAR